MMRRKISLPVAISLHVKNYALYPGLDGSGLTLNFVDGVTVFAGINGVGKTTLLSLLLRMILGPTNPKKSDQDLGRVSSRELVAIKKFNYFQDRVPLKLDDKAIATFTFLLGDRKIEISRLLRSMSLKSIFIDGRRKQIHEDIEVLEALAKIAGFESAYDFHIAVRYLQFFTEERLPILWDPATQFEFFKILMVDQSVARRLNEHFAEVQRIDTDYRNRKHQLNKKRADLVPLRPRATQELVDIETHIAEARTSYEAITEKFTQKKDLFDELQKQQAELDQSYEIAEIRQGELESQFVSADAQYIALALPSLEDKLQFLMQGFAVGAGCFVCGNKTKKQSSDISRKLRQNQCFVCSSPVKAVTGASVTPISVAKVREIEDQLAKVGKELQDIGRRRAENGAASLESAKLLREESTAYHEARRRLEALEAQRPQGSASQNDLEAEIEREENALKALDLARKASTTEYRNAVSEAQIQIDQVKEAIRDKFTAYAQAFLHETVDVSFDRNISTTIATGAGKVNIPAFSISMTSSTHKVPRKRLTTSNVSESQKEFLDLSFRMALIDLIAGSSAAMMVVETPEASLDSWFMRKAAYLIREFSSKAKHRKALVTSNLNGTRMIPHLLGLVNDDDSLRKLSQLDSAHLIDLMKLTARASILDETEAQTMLLKELANYVEAQ